MAKKTRQKRLILVTNDDGIEAPGLKILAERVDSLGEVHIVAPEREQSAVGHSITLRHPLRIRKVGPRTTAVEGTPTDCVMLAYYRLLPARLVLLQSTYFSYTRSAARFRPTWSAPFATQPISGSRSSR